MVTVTQGPRPGRLQMGAHLQGEGVIRGVEDAAHHFSHTVLHDLLLYFCYALHLGVHGADDRLFPLVQLVSHQGKAEGHTPRSIGGLAEVSTGI